MRAGDKAVLSCETDSLPEPAVTWYKDGQPLVPAPRTQTLQGGQKLAILDTQVSDPGVWAAIQCHLLNLAGGWVAGRGGCCLLSLQDPKPS